MLDQTAYFLPDSPVLIGRATDVLTESGSNSEILLRTLVVELSGVFVNLTVASPNI